jgi:hypothetical protein
MNPMGELDAGEGDGCGPEGFEGEHRCEAALDHAMVLLDDVVEMSARSHRDRLPPGILLAEQK